MVYCKPHEFEPNQNVGNGNEKQDPQANTWKDYRNWEEKWIKVIGSQV